MITRHKKQKEKLHDYIAGHRNASNKILYQFMIKSKNQTNLGTLKSQVSNHKKQKKLLIYHWTQKVYLIQNSLQMRDFKKTSEN